LSLFPQANATKPHTKIQIRMRTGPFPRGSKEPAWPKGRATGRVSRRRFSELYSRSHSPRTRALSWAHRKSVPTRLLLRLHDPLTFMVRWEALDRSFGFRFIQSSEEMVRRAHRATLATRVYAYRGS
jgi:hypothetical protein